VTLESFVGILVASFWGAIFLSKVTRVSSFAQVTFSDPLLIRYGSGVVSQEDDDEDAKSSDHDNDEEKIAPLPVAAQSRMACPVLDFRILNRLQRQKRGEIIDASMNIVASIDESQAAARIKDAKRTVKRRGGKKGKAKKGVAGSVRRFSIDNEVIDQEELKQSKGKVLSMLADAKKRNKGLAIIDEEPTEDLAKRKIFAKLEIESQEHPFFKRMWVAKHTLDQESPLLKQEAKDLVRLNNGYWPQELNNADAVRACVQFDQIVVSLSGTSNADCNSVYAQKVYDYVDLCVGYKFCNVLFRGVDGSLIVDPDLLNDVVEQVGGGGEDLHERVVENRTSDIFIL
jgi:hypothetical protein